MDIRVNRLLWRSITCFALLCGAALMNPQATSPAYAQGTPEQRAA